MRARIPRTVVMMAAVIEADQTAAPAELAAGIGQTEKVSFNRRFVMSHGRVRFNPGSRNPEIERPSLGARMKMVYAPMQEYSEEELAWAQDGDAAQRHSFERPFPDRRRRRMKIRSLHRMRERGKAVPPTIESEPWTLPPEVQPRRAQRAQSTGGGWSVRSYEPL
jgi:hypothetical protein